MKSKMKQNQARCLLASESKCPFCKSSETDYDNTQFDAGQASQEASCFQCEKRWIEVYTISEIVEVES